MQAATAVNDHCDLVSHPDSLGGRSESGPQDCIINLSPICIIMSLIRFLTDDGSHFAITGYLQCLAAERKQLIGLGQVLGLRYSRLKGIDSSSFLEDMIAAWLRKEDDVMTRCPPTWRNLVLALRDKRVQQNGIAATIIAKEKVQL